MEGFGVLRAASLAGVPAVELRVISNEIGQEDRSRWDLAAAFTALERAIPLALDAVTDAAATARGS
jgi:futalosine hydrolase